MEIKSLKNKLGFTNMTFYLIEIVVRLFLGYTKS